MTNKIDQYVIDHFVLNFVNSQLLKNMVAKKFTALLWLLLMAHSTPAAKKIHSTMKSDSTIALTGYIKKQSATEKGSKIEERTDYFFQEVTNDKRGKLYFIKLSDGNVSQAEVDKLLTIKEDGSFRSQVVKVNIKHRNGYLDVPQAEQQPGLHYPSRTGPYITIESIAAVEESGMAGPSKAAGERVEWEGRFVKHHQVSKRGKKLETFDLYFVEKKTKKEYFVRVLDSPLPRVTIEKYLDSTPDLKIVAVLSQGLWDTNNPEHQSRVGEYIFVQSIEEEER